MSGRSKPGSRLPLPRPSSDIQPTPEILSLPLVDCHSYNSTRCFHRGGNGVGISARAMRWNVMQPEPEIVKIPLIDYHVSWLQRKERLPKWWSGNRGKACNLNQKL